MDIIIFVIIKWLLYNNQPTLNKPEHNNILETRINFLNGSEIKISILKMSYLLLGCLCRMEPQFVQTLIASTIQLFVCNNKTLPC